jgi:aryl-alcohol dehydrogenase-like predicted oxidoreductase
MTDPGRPLFSRRGFIGSALAAGTLSRLARAAEPPAAPLITKPIPATGERLPAIGLGTDAFRNDLSEEIRAELRRMSELGGTVIDTAAAYGDSEAIIGEALAALKLRERMFLATKLVGSGAADSLARSLARLKTQRLDLLQVHNLNGVAELIPTLQQWKKNGTIRYVGITTSRVSQHAELLEAMRSYPLDFIQVDYSLGNREAAEKVLPLAQERKLAVLVNLPFGRSSLFEQAAGRQLPAWAADIDVTTWGQFFLKYVISHPAVTCAIPGSTKVNHLEDNQGAGRGRLPDAAVRRKMEQYWDTPTASAGS